MKMFSFTQDCIPLSDFQDIRNVKGQLSIDLDSYMGKRHLAMFLRYDDNGSPASFHINHPSLQEFFACLRHCIDNDWSDRTFLFYQCEEGANRLIAILDNDKREYVVYNHTKGIILSHAELKMLDEAVRLYESSYADRTSGLTVCFEVGDE